jgi:cobalt-precorrin-5B (C1)-methyltransferase
LELCQARQELAPLQRIVELALGQCETFVAERGGGLELEVILIDFEGRVLGRASGGQAATGPTSEATPLVQRLSADPAHSYDEESLLGDPGQPDPAGTGSGVES